MVANGLFKDMDFTSDKNASEFFKIIPGERFASAISGFYRLFTLPYLSKRFSPLS